MLGMQNTDALSNIDNPSTIVKDLEKRWGLTLVSFLPSEAQERIVLLQTELSKLVYKRDEHNKRGGEPVVDFYKSSQLHCTHLTLTRSNAWGPVQMSEFVKPGYSLFDLFKKVRHIASQITYINVKIDSIRMSSDGLGIILLGKCSDNESVRNRRLLLEYLNDNLSKTFNLSRRKWDTDPSQYNKIHCRIGFVKRKIDRYDSFINDIATMALASIEFTFKDIAIIHHQYRSLYPPHQGIFSLQLGMDRSKGITEEEFISQINLGS